jgi:hypothetical protein
MSQIHSVVASLLQQVARVYFRPFELILGGVANAFGFGFSVSLDAGSRRPIDERIAKIDEARRNLQEALGALEELTTEAERNKAELDQAVRRLGEARAEHASEARQLAEVKRIAQSDVEAFRRMAGLTSPAKERWIGFFGGIAASLVAALI